MFLTGGLRVHHTDLARYAGWRLLAWSPSSSVSLGHSCDRMFASTSRWRRGPHSFQACWLGIIGRRGDEMELFRPGGRLLCEGQSAGKRCLCGFRR
jgi:hypothetical protein